MTKAKLNDFEIAEANLEDEWDELFFGYWNSWKTPLQASGELTFAHLGEGNAEEEAAFATTKAAYLEIARDDRNQQHWIRARDMQTGSIVGGAMWTQCRENPFRAPIRQLQATWFEERSEMRELAESMYEQLCRYRANTMTVPHAYGNALWVDPQYRDKAVGGALVGFCLDQIDDQYLETFMEATRLSTGIALLHGFIVVGHTNMIFPKKDPSPRWKRLVRDLQANPISILWRPVRGEYQEGETILPWEGRARTVKL